MKNNTIHYLVTKEDLVPAFRYLYESQGYKFVALNPAEMLPDDLQVLLLIEPLRLGRSYFAVNRLWKHFLHKHRPDVRLVVAMYAQSNHTNVFSLLDFPQDFAGFLNAAKPVSAYPFAHIGTEEKNGEKLDKYLDTWTVSLPHSGRPAITEMQHFLNGHDRGRSFAAQLFQMRTLVVNGYSDEAGNEAPIAEQLQKEFNYLYQRWYYYKRLFPYLPFGQVLSEIESQLESIKALLLEDSLLQSLLQKELTAIYHLTQAEIHPIVFSEDYW